MLENLLKNEMLLCAWQYNDKSPRQKLHPYLIQKQGSSVKTFDVSLDGKSKNYKGYSLDQFIDLLLNQKYNQHSTVRMMPETGDRSQGGGWLIRNLDIDRDVLLKATSGKKDEEQSSEELLVLNSSNKRSSLSGLEEKEDNNVTAGKCVDEKTYVVIANRRGQPKFRESLLAAFNGRCFISGSSVKGVLKAAHIIPYAEDKDYKFTNGLLLRADLHTLYDINLIGVDGDGTVHLSEDLNGSEYAEYAGQKISDHELPKELRNNLQQRFEKFQSFN